MHKITGICVLGAVLTSSVVAVASQPIIDSRMSFKEAMDGLSSQCPDYIKNNQALVNVSYYGIDGNIHVGQVVIDKRLANDVRTVFEVALEGKFPIQSAIPISHPQFRKNDSWSDDLSMMANNTSAFNYRAVTGAKKLSNHAYGFAIDINPLWNPYVKGKKVLPLSAQYRQDRPGTLTEDHPVVQAFLSLGWDWGGHWTSLKDYQHFEKVLPVHPESKP